MSRQIQSATDKSSGSKSRSYIFVIYDLYTGSRLRHYVIFGSTLFIALSYAMFSELVLRRPLRHIVYEAAAIAVLLLLTLPIVGRLSSHKQVSKSPTPLVLLFAVLAVMLIISGGSFLALTIHHLQISVQASNEIIERTTGLLEKANAMLQETSRELQRRQLTTKQATVTVTAKEPGSIPGDNVVIRLIGTHRDDLDPTGFRVTATIESHDHLYKANIIDAPVDANKTYRYASGSVGYTIKIVKANDISASFLIDRSVDKSGSS